MGQLLPAVLSSPLSILILLASGLLQNLGYFDSRAHSSLNKEPNTEPEAQLPAPQAGFGGAAAMLTGSLRRGSLLTMSCSLPTATTAGELGRDCALGWCLQWRCA